MKDVPMVMEPEFALPCITGARGPARRLRLQPLREPRRHAPGAVVGTSSLRRESQIHAQYPFLGVTQPAATSIPACAKLDEGQYDAIILAAAGLTRFGLGERIRSVMPAEVRCPRPGGRARHRMPVRARGRDRLAAAARSMPTPPRASRRARVARARRQLRGAVGRLRGDTRGAAVVAREFVARPDGSTIVRTEREGASAEAEALGRARRRPAGAGRGSDPPAG